MTRAVAAALERLRHRAQFGVLGDVDEYEADLTLVAAALEGGAREMATLRELLWLRHGCVALYGDDGERQCGACVIDFTRDAPEQIAARFEQIGRATLAAQAGAREGEAPTQIPAGSDEENVLGLRELHAALPDLCPHPPACACSDADLLALLNAGTEER